MNESEEREEEILLGIPLSRGIAIGLPFFLVSQKKETLFSLDASFDPSKEKTRYRFALSSSLSDVQLIKKKLMHEGASDAASILEAHEHILQDPLFTTYVEEEIFQKKTKAEYAFISCIENLKESFFASKNTVLKDRFLDIEDVAGRVLHYLDHRPFKPLERVLFPSIVITKELNASETAIADPNQILAFVTEEGSEHCHSAIVAKAKGIPYVGRVKINLEQLDCSKPLIIDARTGLVIIHPKHETLKKYLKLQKEILKQKDLWGESINYPTETKDGKKITLGINAGEETRNFDFLKLGAEKIGLLRSEFLFLDKKNYPDEEEQMLKYSEWVKLAKNHLVSIRTFDLRKDKVNFLFQKKDEEIHSLRFWLKHQDYFKAQLRAILRSSFYGKIQILFPMVASLYEFKLAKLLLEEAKDDLRRKKIPFSSSIAVGAMIEVPSSAITSDLIANECDFLSIGTNDLLQYASGMERTKGIEDSFQAPLFFSLFRMVQLIVQNAKNAGKPVSICGDIATDPRFIPFLIGLGVEEFSVPCKDLAMIKYVIQNLSYEEAKNLFFQWDKKPQEEIVAHLTEFYQEKFPQDFFCSF